MHMRHEVNGTLENNRALAARRVTCMHAMYACAYVYARLTSVGLVGLNGNGTVFEFPFAVALQRGPIRESALGKPNSISS